MHRTLQSALHIMLLSKICMTEQGLNYSKIKLWYFKKGQMIIKDFCVVREF